MNFLVDAHLPRRVAYWLKAAGHQAIHTLDLPEGNRTTDAALNSLSLENQAILVTKDSDFVNSFILQRQPYKLLLISTGNVTNNVLESLIQHNLALLVNLFESHNFLELTRDGLVLHS
ncbi:MAG: DUF5615 family PIN-like protein [Chloroflexi bacterium]|uniref:DUF5615 family PIN-like protein n=1 Tax=Candidatus Chlorohelix allophototropha TaxID=3003348 RepID=A0A8T7MAA5_9CHLR|nr:DUF5615 family PIN-like protein [Chloroflexota bacterium]WJW70428.1 DUF5615 family PIN-like protein [Chloroflexota bacterium L227-S17]